MHKKADYRNICMDHKVHEFAGYLLKNNVSWSPNSRTSNQWELHADEKVFAIILHK